VELSRTIGFQAHDTPAIIKELHHDSSCDVFLPVSDIVIPRVPQHAMMPYPPSKKDRVKVIRGIYKGNTGLLLSTYGNDVIVKLDVSHDVKILPVSSLAKLSLLSEILFRRR